MGNTNFIPERTSLRTYKAFDKYFFYSLSCPFIDAMHGVWKVSRWGIALRVDTHEKLVDHFISEDHNTSTLFSYFV